MPHCQKQDFAVSGEFENVVSTVSSGDFEEVRAPRIRAQDGAGIEQQAQFDKMLRRMISEVLDNQWEFPCTHIRCSFLLLSTLTK